MIEKTSSQGAAVKLYVPLTRAEFEALREVARAERRRPQDHAAFIVAKQLCEQERATGANRADLAAPVAATK
jgi:hypothetical protein